MKAHKDDMVVTRCESVIHEHRKYNIEKKILPGCVRIADCMLDRRNELAELYRELYCQLDTEPEALWVFFDIVFSCAAYWNPDKNKAAREERNELKDVNGQIADTASELAVLLEARSELNNTSSFYSDTYGGVCEILDAAGSGNFSYESWVQEQFKQLFHRFDYKYWPSLPEFLDEVARDAQEAKVYASDKITAAAITGPRGSLAEFLRAFYEGIDQNTKRSNGFLPSDFRLTDKSVAALMNCILDLAPDDMKDSAYVKRFRQSERTRQ